MRPRRGIRAVAVVALVAVAAVTVVTVGENVAAEKTAAVAETAAADRAATPYGIRIALLPSPDLNDVFACKVEIRDLATDEVVSRPMLLARWGETAELEQTDHVRGRVVTVKAVVDESGHTAEYSVQVAENGRPVASQEAIVVLSDG